MSSILPQNGVLPLFYRRQDDKGPVVVLEGGGSHMFYGKKMGVTNYLLPRMILQLPSGFHQHIPCSRLVRFVNQAIEAASAAACSLLRADGMGI